MMSESDAEHAARVDVERRRRVERLRGESSWFNVVGLHWLSEGDATLGSSTSNDIVLPGGPAHAGAIEVRDGVATLVAHGGDLTVGGQPVDRQVLIPDTRPDSNEVAIDRVRIHAIVRGGRLALRVVDADSRARRTFEGLEYFPVDTAWRLVGRLEPATGEIIAFPTILGTEERQELLGTITFEIAGEHHRLAAIREEGHDGLFLIFGDETNRVETYHSGRYLYTQPPAGDGVFVIDFNLAMNPPCAFTRAATCSLPPARNRLPIRVTAGERRYAGPVAGPAELPALPDG